MSLHEEETTKSLEQRESDPSAEAVIERDLEMANIGAVSQNPDVHQESCRSPTFSN